MARDYVRVMEHLGHKQFFLCGHDRGARVGHALLTIYPSAVSKAILLDICPTLSMFMATDQRLATAYYHCFFLIQPSPFPENMILSNPRLFAEKSLLGLASTSISPFGTEAFAAYFAGLFNPASVYAMCENYRAAATVDLKDLRENISEGRKIECPLRVLWGKKGVIEECFDAVKDWREVAEERMVDQGSKAVESGHYIPEEEMPEELLVHVKEFLVDG
ncbi:Alpha/Beta hydrolase protein [Cryomyces antarcticus]